MITDLLHGTGHEVAYLDTPVTWSDEVDYREMLPEVYSTPDVIFVTAATRNAVELDLDDYDAEWDCVTHWYM